MDRGRSVGRALFGALWVLAGHALAQEPAAPTVGAAAPVVASSASSASDPSTSTSTSTTPTADSQALAPVEIVGLKNGSRIGYDRLLRANAVFAANRARAPGAEFRFEGHDRATEPKPPLVVKLEVGERRFPIDVGADHRFDLPTRDVTGPGDGEVLGNRRAGELRIFPSVRSPGTSAEHRRLGDLRVECEILWALYREDSNFFVRNEVDAAGGLCHVAQFAVGMPVPRPLASAVLTSGERSLNLRISANRLNFTPPMHDTGWPDDATLVLVFE